MKVRCLTSALISNMFKRNIMFAMFFISFPALAFATHSHWCGYQPRWTKTTRTAEEFDWNKKEVPMNDKTMTYMTNNT